MSVEENKAVARRIVEEVFNNGDLSLIPELISPDYILHGSMELKGQEGFRQYVRAVRSGFPDVHLTIANIFADGEMVAIFYTVTGAFKGEFRGIPPTGRKLSWPVAILCRYADAREIETWGYSDMLTFYQQLGVTPPKQ